MPLAKNICFVFIDFTKAFDSIKLVVYFEQNNYNQQKLYQLVKIYVR